MNIQQFPICPSGSLYNNSKIIKTGHPKSLLRGKLIEIYPTDEQKQILTQWFHIYRWAYNLAVKYYRINPLTKDNLKFNFLRNELTTQYHDSIYNYTEKTGIPKHTIDNAFRDVITAYKAALTNLKNGNIKHFFLRYKKKDKPTETLCLEPAAFHKRYNSWSVRTMGNYIRSSSSICNTRHTSRLTINKKTGKMILAVPHDAPEYKCQNRRKIISLDPGVVTFQTSYDKHNTSDIGVPEGDKILNLLKRLKILKKKPNITIKNYHKVEKRLITRIQNIRDDLHWKTALKLVRNYDTVLIGNMSTKAIIKKNKSVMTALMKQKCQMLSNDLFKRRLVSKAEEYGVTVRVVDESYTSKTCGGCQYQHLNLGRSRVFNCPYCTFVWGRDQNGARNIMLVDYCLFKTYHP